MDSCGVYDAIDRGGNKNFNKIDCIEEETITSSGFINLFIYLLVKMNMLLCMHVAYAPKDKKIL